MLGESENRCPLTRPALSTRGRAIRYPRLFHLAASLLLLLPVSLQAADHFTTVDLGKTLNAEHAKAFTETIGFDTWFAQPQVTLHGIPFTLTTGRADLGDGGWYHCAPCRDLKASDQSLLAMNALAREMQKVRADARVVFLAYHDTEEAPARVSPEPAVTLLWAPRERCYVHALDDPQCPRNVAYLQRLEGCLKVFAPGQAEAFEYYLDQILYADLVPTLPHTLAGHLRSYTRWG